MWRSPWCTRLKGADQYELVRVDIKVPSVGHVGAITASIFLARRALDLDAFDRAYGLGKLLVRSCPQLHRRSVFQRLTRAVNPPRLARVAEHFDYAF